MNICVIGTGYVGLITACGFARLGHSVKCVDIDAKKVGMINNSQPPIYEDGLKEILSEVAGKSLSATTDAASAVSSSEVVFITVGTPSREDGSIDLSHINPAFLGILPHLTPAKIVIVKSTVVPGTTDSLALLGEQKSGKKAGKDYGLCMNPEFLREGKAIYDFFNPDRIVLGVEDENSSKALSRLYSSFKCPIIKTNRKTAEMIKYVSNSFLATKISFSNEVGNLCKRLGIDTYEVMEAVGMDNRIGRPFLNSGIGYGGSCFPKDVKALISLYRQNGMEPRLLDTVVKINDEQPLRIVELAKHKANLKGAKVAVLGLAFKPDSDDIREAPSLKVIGALLDEGAEITVYDPQAMENAKKILGSRVSYASSAKDAVVSSDLVFLLTEWKEFEVESLYAGKSVFDGRKVLNRKSEGSYEGICW